MSPSPVSEAQFAANRQNAKLSTGPATEEGKTRTRLNGLRHGLTGQTVFLPDEDRAAYDLHHAEFLDTLRPGSVIEKQMAHQIADSYWRLNRIKAIEDNIFALGIESHAGEFRDDPESNAALSQAQTWLEQSRQLNLLSLYEQRVNRSILSLQKEYKSIRDNRLSAEAQRAEALRRNERHGKMKTSGFSFGATYGLRTDSSPADPKAARSNSILAAAEAVAQCSGQNGFAFSGRQDASDRELPDAIERLHNMPALFRQGSQARLRPGIASSARPDSGKGSPELSQKGHQPGTVTAQARA